MDTSNIGKIVVSNINVEIINQAIKQRAEALGSQMNSEASSQFISDMSEIVCLVESEGSSVSFKVEPSSSYLLNYLQSHGMPVAGGDNGTAHNVDGSTYESRVPERLWGTPLPEYELPIIEGNDEAMHMVRLMAPDAVKNAMAQSKPEIAQQIVVPFIKEKIASLGGG